MLNQYFQFIICLITGHHVKHITKQSGGKRGRTSWRWHCQRCGYSFAAGRRGGFNDPDEVKFFTKRFFPSSGYYGKKWLDAGVK